MLIIFCLYFLIYYKYYGIIINKFNLIILFLLFIYKYFLFEFIIIFNFIINSFIKGLNKFN